MSEVIATSDYSYSQGYQDAIGRVHWLPFNEISLPQGQKEFLVWLNKPFSFRRLHTACMVGADQNILIIGSVHAHDMPKDVYVTHWAPTPKGP